MAAVPLILSKYPKQFSVLLVLWIMSVIGRFFMY